METIDVVDFTNFALKYNLIDTENGFVSLEFFLRFEHTSDGYVHITGLIPLTIAYEMYAKFAHTHSELFYNTKHGVTMDPIMLAVDSFIERKNLPREQLLDYARNVNDFVSSFDDHYINYTTVCSHKLLTWFMSKLQLHRDIGNDNYRMKGRY